MQIWAEKSSKYEANMRWNHTLCGVDGVCGVGVMKCGVMKYALLKVFDLVGSVHVGRELTGYSLVGHARIDATKFEQILLPVRGQPALFLLFQ